MAVLCLKEISASIVVLFCLIEIVVERRFNGRDCFAHFVSTFASELFFPRSITQLHAKIKITLVHSTHTHKHSDLSHSNHFGRSIAFRLIERNIINEPSFITWSGPPISRSLSIFSIGKKYIPPYQSPQWPNLIPIICISWPFKRLIKWKTNANVLLRALGFLS